MAAAHSSTAPLKYVVGIANAKDAFMACFGRIDTHPYLTFGKETTFVNTPAGFAALLVWTAKQQVVAAPQWVVREAMGVYYEELAYFLADNARTLSVLLPNKVKHFAQSTEQKSKMDRLDARLLCRLLCRLGLTRALPAWQPPAPALRQLRALSRERQRLPQQAARLKTQRRAYQLRYQPDARTLARLTTRMQLLAQQLKAMDQDLAALLDTESERARRLAHLASVPGIDLTTAIVVVAEANGFVLIENERQVASHAGLDVVQRQSGLSTGATRISRRGNVRLRTARYLPAVSSLRFNPQQMTFYARLRARQSNGKPGVIAVMRKLLLPCYSL